MFRWYKCRICGNLTRIYTVNTDKVHRPCGGCSTHKVNGELTLREHIYISEAKNQKGLTQEE